MFTKEQFIEFIISHCEKVEPNFQFDNSNLNDPLQYILTHKQSQAQATLNLHNIWEDYLRIGELNVIIDFMNHQLQVFQFTNRMNQDFKGVDLTKIYPTLRPYSFRSSQENGDEYLHDKHVPKLETLYIENQPGFFVFLSKEYVKPALIYKNEEEIKLHAFENLRKKGWNPEHYQIPSPTMGQHATFHVYVKTEYPFQHQFFLPDLAQKHLSASYLCAVPARDMAVVLTTSNPLDSVIAAKKTAIQSGFSTYVNMCFHGEPRPISNNMYWIHGGRPYCLHW